MEGLKTLELALLYHWQTMDVKEVYKYKHRVKAFFGPASTIELFTDLTSGGLFTDVKDSADYTGVLPEDIKVRVDDLIKSRGISERFLQEVKPVDEPDDRQD